MATKKRMTVAHERVDQMGLDEQGDRRERWEKRACDAEARLVTLAAAVRAFVRFDNNGDAWVTSTPKTRDALVAALWNARAEVTK